MDEPHLFTCLKTNIPMQNCEDKFTEVASSPNFTFIGNVAVGHAPAHRHGHSVALATLLRHYDAIVFAYGASKDRTLNIPGEASLARIYSAREFVGWYNGLPEFSALAPDLTQEEAVVIGQGNVALDVARILLEDVDRLRATDMAEYAVAALAQSRVRRVRLVGRRGAMQAAFSTKELRQQMNLPGVGFEPVDKELIPPDLKKLPRALKRRMEVLLKGSGPSWQQQPKKWSLDFCLSPHSFQPDVRDTSAVGSTTFQRNHLTDTHDPEARVESSSAEGEVTFESPLVFRSIGYKSEPLPEFKSLGIAFDQRKGVIGNYGESGRVSAIADTDVSKRHFPGLYCAGWVKRGPTGVIASTMEDAFETAQGIVHDWQTGEEFLGTRFAVKDREAQSAGWEGVKSEGGSELAKCVVDWNGWLAIDRAEKELGEKRGKKREKASAVEKMLELATSRIP